MFHLLLTSIRKITTGPEPGGGGAGAMNPQLFRMSRIYIGGPTRVAPPPNFSCQFPYACIIHAR